MQRRIRVAIDRSTWPSSPGPPPLPRTFQAGPYNVDIPTLLLTIGYLTTPTHTSGVSLSSFWALVRYLHAVSSDSDLRIDPAFSELDSHQKAILSDDFGIGVPIRWLLDHLPIASIVDGRYFIQRMARTVGAYTVDPARRGPAKSPDFVARDTTGIWHVVECKGTQSGTAYRNRQLGNPNNPIDGAVAQKRTITFPQGYAGQRLACGLVLAALPNETSSSLKIIDPDEKPIIDIREDDMSLAVDTLGRGTAVRALRLAGFDATAVALASLPASTLGSEVREELSSGGLKEDVTTTTDRAMDELRDAEDRTSFTVAGRGYCGRQAMLDLLTPLVLEDRTIRSALLRYGVDNNFLRELAPTWIQEQPLLGEYVKVWDSIKFEFEGLTARMHVGSLFVADIIFRPSSIGMTD